MLFFGFTFSGLANWAGPSQLILSFKFGIACCFIKTSESSPSQKMHIFSVSCWKTNTVFQENVVPGLTYK